MKKEEKEAKEKAKEQERLFKKAKPVLSKGSVKRIVLVKNVDEAGCYWMENWIDQLVRGYSYPPQLKSDDFYSLLGRYFDSATILSVLERARVDYRRAFPMADPQEEADDLSWLVGTLRADPNALIDLPPNYLG
jgi:hypothetical protein